MLYGQTRFDTLCPLCKNMCALREKSYVRKREREREREGRRPVGEGERSGGMGAGCSPEQAFFFCTFFFAMHLFFIRVCKNVRFRHFLSPTCSKMYRFCKQNTTLGPSPWLLAKTMKFATLRSLHRSRVIPQPLCFKPPPCGQAYYFSIHRCMCMCICVCLFSCVVWLHLACRCRIGASALR